MKTTPISRSRLSRMVANVFRKSVCLSIFLLGIDATLTTAHAQSSGEEVSQSVTASELKDWLDALSSPSYHHRRGAELKLSEAGLAARPVLIEGLSHPKLDVRVLCQRLLAGLQGSERDAELNRLQFSYHPGHVYVLPGWEKFRRAGGDSVSHRTLYVQLVKRHSMGLQWIDSLSRAAKGASEEIATLPESWGLDSQRLAGGDTIDWAFLLLVASQPQVKHTPTLMSQVYGGLLDHHVSQKLLHEDDQGPLKSLIRSWVSAQDDPIPRRTLIQVCLRYGFFDEAASLSLKILNQGGAPSATQYALLALTRMHMDNEEEHLLRNAIKDRRVCHTWQVANPEPHTVKTEVRDTALALLLRRQGMTQGNLVSSIFKRIRIRSIGTTA